MLKSLLLASVIGFGLTVAHGTDHSAFEQMKQEFADADCLAVHFLSITESEVFGDIDTLDASALIARSGRYLIDLGSDVYAYDGQTLISYSRIEAQATLEKRSADDPASELVTVLTRLDELYATTDLGTAEAFRLTRRRATSTVFPESIDLLVAYKDNNSVRLDYLEYQDANGDRNRLVFSRVEALDCPDDVGQLIVPDTVDIIYLDW